MSKLKHPYIKEKKNPAFRINSVQNLPRLTVEEHLIFYANLKTGGNGSKEEIDQMIKDLDLSHKRNELSLHLSGGTKRKLSIGTAFIGHSKCG